MNDSVQKFYDTSYTTPNYFGHRRWLYSRYASAVISHAKLRQRANVLDYGCGQGFFTDLFYRAGANPFGVDISPVGIEQARKVYPEIASCFSVLCEYPPRALASYDCVFVRSCSEHNIAGLRTSLTHKLFDAMDFGSCLVFAYNSNLSGSPRSGWINHTLDDVRDHFSKIGAMANFEVFFVNKIDMLILGTKAFSRPVMMANAAASHLTGASGEIIVFARKISPNASSVDSRSQSSHPN